MSRATIAGGAFATMLVLAVAACDRAIEHDADPAATSDAVAPPPAAPYEGLLYGRVTTDDGAVHVGRLRFGGDEEALWSNYFNGFKDGNPWVEQVPSDRLPKRRESFGIFGIQVASWESEIDLGRPFMARFGDIARIDGEGRDLRVTLKSGTVVELNRFSADDFADGVRVWDDKGGVVDLGEREIRSIELLPAVRSEAAPHPLSGTVRTSQGDFTGLIQWNRKACLGSDELEGFGADGEIRLRFDDIRSIARLPRDRSMVTLLDGREIVLSDVSERGGATGGIYVDDPRYGRVLVSWDAFERVEFSAGASGPAYGGFPAGRPLRGSVITRSGDRIAGRLVYDLDESETTETLDAPSQGVDYTIPFELIASIVPAGLEERGSPRVSVTLQSGEVLQLDGDGDLSERNAGLLIFVDGSAHPEYVLWTDIERLDFDRSPEM